VRHNDQHFLQHWVHRTLLAGLVISSALLICGIVAMLVQGHEQVPRHESLSALLHEAAALNGPAITTLGLLVLMITPMMRVIVLLIGWTLERNTVFATVALVVLGLLILSLSLGVG
jgi:uncharacterized membrane protein